ncbi:MAG: hypothetical protein MZV63_15290 [Marinilabiliales bacterium]|nr:hypothetical protein [Marinilabiliales bacterium]
MKTIQENQVLRALVSEEMPWLLTGHTNDDYRFRIDKCMSSIIQKSEWKSKGKFCKEQEATEQLLASADPAIAFITQYVVSGLGHLYKMQILRFNGDNQMYSFVWRAVEYLDRPFWELQ